MIIFLLKCKFIIFLYSFVAGDEDVSIYLLSNFQEPEKTICLSSKYFVVSFVHKTFN